MAQFINSVIYDGNGSEARIVELQIQNVLSCNVDCNKIHGYGLIQIKVEKAKHKISSFDGFVL